MEQLINITTVPIEYKLNIEHARLEYSSSKAEVEISRDEGGLTMRSKPIKVNIDTFEARSSMYPTTKQSIAQLAEKGMQASYEATAEFSKEGKLMLKAKIGDDILNQIFAQRNQKPTGSDFELDFLPKGGAQFDVEPASLEINYELDKLNFDLKIQQGNFEFIPGSIELEIIQKPSIEIEYVGKPIYVPPSASPDYEPVDITI